MALGVLDLLAFAEAVIAPLANNRGAVEEDVSPLTLDEPETLVRQLLYGTVQRIVSHSTQERLAAAPCCNGGPSRKKTQTGPGWRARRGKHEFVATRKQAAHFAI